MTFLASIHDADLGFSYVFPEVFETRTAARAILTDTSGRMAYMHNQGRHHHKLPGGGVEADESLEQALHREMLEETGCHIHNVTYLGKLEEFRGRKGFLQTSHLFRAEVEGAKGIPQFDPSEIAENFSLKWLTPAEAMALLKAESGHEDYSLRFMNAREQALLKASQQG